MCIRDSSVTNEQLDFIVQAINDAHGVKLPTRFFTDLGKETLRLEHTFNRAAGFIDDDDELPAFFYSEELPPSSKAARFHTAEVNRAAEQWWG